MVRLITVCGNLRLFSRASDLMFCVDFVRVTNCFFTITITITMKY